MYEAMSSRSDLSVLLGQTGWTRSLARSLASDAHLAEDLVQDAWVAALERPPDLGSPVRGWIASVLRHRWLDLRRGRERRAERERRAAELEAWPSAHDVVEKAALQRAVVEAVLELDEPYRTTVLLRYFEDLPQREIAERMRTTTATVNSRLTRALAKLRLKLSRGGGPTAWLRVLVPLLVRPETPPAVALGAGVMKAIATSVVVAASIVAGLALWASKAAEPPALGPRPLPAAAAEHQSVEPAQAAVAAPSAAAAERTPVAVESAPSIRSVPEPAAALAAPRTVRGRVLDETGLPVPGIALALSQDVRVACTSAAGGWFEIAVDGPAEAIVAADPRWVTVLAGSARVQEPTQSTVVIAPRIELAGLVLDQTRATLADAALELCLPAGFGAEWGFALDYSLPQHWCARSAADGRFDLGAVPAVPGAVLQAELAGFAPYAEEAPPGSASALEVVLARPHESAGLVRGVVLDPAGERVPGARVSGGEEIARTDEHGEFALTVRPDGSCERLVALAPGHLPAVYEPERDERGAPLWPADVVLELGGPAAAIAGRVVDADGEPVAGAKVWLDDPTPFGKSADTRHVAEALLGGDERFWSFVFTGADGAFSIGGLLERSYRLQAVDPRTLASVESAPVSAASSPVELCLPTRDVHERVAGHIVTASGQPIPGVRVRLFRITYELEHEQGTDNDSEESEPVITGEDGAFEFRGVPRSGVDVIATGDTILGAAAMLAQEKDLEGIEIVASLRLHLQVELDEPRDRADRLQVLDRAGRPVLLSVFHGPGAHASFEMPILDGRSAVLSVEERAALLVLHRGPEEVATIPLHLAPGPTNLIRY